MNKFSKHAFYLSTLVIVLAYGMAAQKYHLFPSPFLHQLVKNAKVAVNSIVGDTKTWYSVQSNAQVPVSIYKPEEVQPGFTLITGIGEGHTLFIKVINFKGEVIHKWDINWHKIWPGATHLPKDVVPKGNPGTHIHGSMLMSNGDVVFNFENLGLVRLDYCGDTVWKTPYPTHHSIDLDEQGHFWVPGQINHRSVKNTPPYFQAPFKEDTIVEISDEGQILTEISIVDVLTRNGYQGLMYLARRKGGKVTVTGDAFHLNDVEVFPRSLTEGVFKHGDIMVSLRNINTVFVFDRRSYKIRYIVTGKFVRQHDPDFIDGNTISIFDNNHISSPRSVKSSKIIMLSAVLNTVTPYVSGTKTLPLYTHKMGKHQWLRNGNLLILESMNGRVLEINKLKQVVWEYNNLFSQGSTVGIMEGAHRLPSSYDTSFFAQQSASCIK